MCHDSINTNTQGHVIGDSPRAEVLALPHRFRIAMILGLDWELVECDNKCYCIDRKYTEQVMKAL